MRKQALAAAILCLFGGVIYAGLSLGRPAAVKKKVSRLDDKVSAARAANVAPNRAPVVSGMVAASTTVAAGASTSISVTASDPDGDALSYVWASTAGVISGTGSVVSWVAPSTTGVYTVVCTVSDGKLSVQSSVSLTVPNRAPVVSGMVAASTTVAAGASTSISVTASDPDGDALSYVWASTAGVISGTGNTINWAAPSVPGVYAVVCTVSDGKLSVQSSVSLTVPNRAPVISGMAAVSTTVAAGGSTSISVTASDPDGDALGYVWTSTAGTISGAGAVVSWTSPSTPGVYAVVCAVSDGGLSVQSSVSVTVVPPGAKKWEFATGGAIRSSPALGTDGTVYVGSADGKLYAVNPDGTQKWVFATVPASPINSSPAIDSDGAVYFGADDGKLHAINCATGLEKMGWPFLAGGAINSSPAVGDDGVVYAGSGDGNVYAINPGGTQKWSYAVGATIHSSPALDADTVYVGADDGYLYAINTADGLDKWSPVGVAGAAINSSPALSSDGAIYLGSDDGYFYSLPPGGGIENWSFGEDPWSPINSSPAIGASGILYVGSQDGNLYARAGSDGSLKWAFPAGGPIQSSPALGADGTVYVGADDGKLYAIDSVTSPSAGIQRWVFATSPASPFRSSPAVASDGTVYAGADDGKLYAVYGNTALAGTQWPKFRRNVKNTGR